MKESSKSVTVNDLHKSMKDASKSVAANEAGPKINPDSYAFFLKRPMMISKKNFQNAKINDLINMKVKV